MANFTCARAVWLAAALVLGSGAAGAESPKSPAFNYMLHCQGCHHADGSGQGGYVPDFRGNVAKFLAHPAGREYLGRVPGTSQSFLTDAERAAVLNWVVTSFDRQNVPSDFQPYTATEMAAYRRNPLSTATAERDRVLRLIADSRATSATAALAGTSNVAAAPSLPALPATEPPPAFGMCAACHPVSADGASGMGPNLRGVIGRRAGSLPGFAYSSAIRSSGIVWSAEALEKFLADVQGTVPGTLMGITSVPEAADRARVIQYLQTLR